MGLGIFTHRCQLSFLSYYLNFTLTDGYSNSNEKAYVGIRFLMNVIQSKQYVSGDFYFLIMTPIFKIDEYEYRSVGMHVAFCGRH